MPLNEIQNNNAIPVKAAVLEQLLALSEALLRDDYTKRVVSDFDESIVAQITDNLNRFCDKAQLNAIGNVYNQEQTVDTFIEVISSFANLDFKQKMPITDNGTVMDALATGINILGEELEQSAASKKELETERNRLNVAQAIAKVGSFEIEIPSMKINWSNQASRIFEMENDPESIYEAAIKKIHPEDVTRIVNLLQTVIETGDDIFTEFKIVLGRTVKNIHVIGESVRNGSGNVSCIRGTLQDITERKFVEDALKLAKKTADEANSAKSRFLANMSHEIRTPLNGILGLTDIMLGESNNSSHKKYLEMIRASGRNLAELINDILDFSKIESGKLSLENIGFNFNEVVVSNINRYKFLAEQKGLTLLHHIDEAIPGQVVGDPIRVSQIITNLLGNAIKFTENGTIGIAFWLIEKNATDAIVQGVVKDTGIGIPGEKINDIFQSFTQADETVTRKYGGTGLGLSIVKNLVTMMKGDINVQSSSSGSAFTFTIKLQIPAKHTHTRSTESGTERLTFPKPLHILIVDDNQINLMVAKKMVRKLGAQVTTAESGVEALKLDVSDFDMVLMDIQMPDIDGYEATRELRKRNYNKPIIALSANAYSEDVQKSLDAGMNDHIQKPYTEKFLFEKLMLYVD